MTDFLADSLIVTLVVAVLLIIRDEIRHERDVRERMRRLG